MDWSMFGPKDSAGRLFEQDAQDAMLRAAQTSQAQGSARLSNAQATSKEEEAAAQKKFAAAMAAGGGADGAQSGSMADQLEHMSRVSMNNGLFSQGSKLATQAALIRSREATASRQDALQTKASIESDLKVLERATGLYEGVQSQQDFDQANAYYAAMFGRPAPTAGMQYSPDIVEKLKSFGMTQTQKLQQQLREIDTQSKIENRDSAIKFRNFRRGILTEDQNLRAQREERLSKVGGKGVAGPTVQERKLAENLIAAEFPDLADRRDELGPAAYAVAARAKQLQQANRALNSDQAVRQALSEEKADGNFAAVDDAYKTLGIPRKGTKYSQPEPLPADRKLVAGKRYNTPRGVVLWDGTKGTLVRPATGATTPSSMGAVLPDEESDETSPDDEENE